MPFCGSGEIKGVFVEKKDQKVCPYLGLDYNREARFPHIEELHRCYRKKSPAYLEPKTQALYCLGADFVRCKRWTAQENVIPASGFVLPSGMMQVPVIAAVVGALLLGLTLFGGNWLPLREGDLFGVSPGAPNAGKVAPIKQAESGPGAVVFPIPTSTAVASSGPTAIRTTIPQVTATRAKVTHLVARGETLYSIANRYGVTVEAIIKANDLTSRDVVNVGQILTIP